MLHFYHLAIRSSLPSPPASLLLRQPTYRRARSYSADEQLRWKFGSSLRHPELATQLLQTLYREHLWLNLAAKY